MAKKKKRKKPKKRLKKIKSKNPNKTRKRRKTQIKKKRKTKKINKTQTKELIFKVSKKWAKKGLVNKSQYEKKYKLSIKDNESFWNKEGKRIDWIKPYTKIKDVKYSKTDVKIKWYYDGTLNASVNCIDRHLKNKQEADIKKKKKKKNRRKKKSKTRG